MLLSLCSDNITSVETIQYEKGNELASNIINKYLSSEAILYDDLCLMENMIRMHNESKPEYLALKADDQVEKIVKTTDKTTQKQLHEEAVVVLELLRDKKVEEEDHNEFPVEHEDVNNRKRKRDDVYETKDLENLIPPDAQRFLKQGRILRIYGEDGVCRSMHFFLSNDMTDIKCKHPKENFVKQKWIIPIHQVKEIKYGYDKKSPIAKSGSIFNKPPPPDKCFSVMGPILLDGPKNFYCVCSNSFEAKRWFDYLTLIYNEYKKVVAQNLKQDIMA